MVRGLETRHGIKEYKRHWESGEVDMTVVTNHIPLLRNILWIFLLEDVYNIDRCRALHLFLLLHNYGRSGSRGSSGIPLILHVYLAIGIA